MLTGCRNLTIHDNEPEIASINLFVIDSISGENIFLASNRNFILDSLFMIKIGTMDTVKIQDINDPNNELTRVDGQIFAYTFDPVSQKMELSFRVDY